MSYKATNGIKLTMTDSGQWKTSSVIDTTVKFAGEEAKDRLYEPKHKKKLVRVLTVVAYVFFVSLAAIMLSLYYVFLWNGDQKFTAKYVTSAPRQQPYVQDCKTILADMQQQLTALETLESETKHTVPTTTVTTEENTTTWQYEYPDSNEDLPRASSFLKKLMDTNDDNY